MAKTDWQIGDIVMPEHMNQIGQDINQNRIDLDEHLAKDASLTQKGHVQLSNAIDSDDETKAATPKSVKDAFNAINKRTLSLQPGVYDDLDLSEVDIVFCYTESGDITINSVLRNAPNHRVRLLKTNASGTLTVKHNTSQGMWMGGARDVVIGPDDRYAFIELQASVNAWYGNVITNKRMFIGIESLGLSDSDLSSTNLESNVLKIINAMGAWSEWGDYCYESKNENLNASCKAALQPLGLPTNIDGFTIRIQTSSNLNVPNQIWIYPNNTMLVYYGSYDGGGSGPVFSLRQIGSAGIKAIHRGVTTVSSTSYVTVNIPTVNMSKTIVNHLGQRGESSDSSNTLCTIELYSSTQLRIKKEYGTRNAYVSWEVIEYE